MHRAFQLRTYLKILSLTLSPLLARSVPYYNRKFASERSPHCPIFIVAAPRTGSTILYQILTNSNEVLYIDNLASQFYKVMPFGLWFSQLIYKNKPHNSFRSKYGNTSSLHAPSESQSFWFRWFPRDRDFVDLEHVSSESIEDLQKTITSMMNHHKKDFLFKNLACGQRIRVLQHAFPNAKFVFLRRDPLYTAQSLLLARRNLKMQDHIWWSVKTRDFKTLNTLPIHEKLMRQIIQVESQIEADLKNVPTENKRKISYENLPSELPDLLTFLGLKKDTGVDLATLKFSNKVKASESDWVLLEAAYKQATQTEGQ